MAYEWDNSRIPNTGWVQLWIWRTYSRQCWVDLPAQIVQVQAGGRKKCLLGMSVKVLIEDRIRKPEVHRLGFCFCCCCFYVRDYLSSLSGTLRGEGIRISEWSEN